MKKLLLVLSSLTFILNANEIILSVEEYKFKNSIAIENYSKEVITLILNAEEIHLKNKQYLNTECIVDSDIYIDNKMITLPCEHKLIVGEK